jgi:guanine deaminase
MLDANGWSSESDIAISNGVIEWVAEPSSPPSEATQVVDAHGDFAIPALVNGHTHAHNGLVRATGDDRWLELHILRMSESSPVWRPDDFYAAAAVGALEMARTGATTAVDMVSASDPDWREKIEAVMAAYRDVGIRATVTPTFADVPFHATLGPVQDELAGETRRALDALARHTSVEAQIERFDDLARRAPAAGEPDSPRVRLGLAPVNPIQCSDALLAACGELAERHGLAVQTHCLESKLQALAGFGSPDGTAVERLARLGLLRPEVSLVHAVWMTDRDIDLVAESGAVVVHCPASNMKLGSGIAPLRRFIDGGIRVQLGTDGSGSGDNQNVFQAMWLAALLSHALTPDPDRWVTAAEAFSLATRSCFSDHPRDGTLRVGAPADVVLLRADSTFLTPHVVPERSLVYSEAGMSVRTVIAGGRVILDGGRSTLVDEAPLVEAVDEAWQRFVRTRPESSSISRVEPSLRALQKKLAEYPYIVERHPAVGRIDA